jgi:RimJ/RimL family protein N-acetyltransferase
MSIKTERLVLRTPLASDAARIALLAGDYAVASMTGTIPHPYDEDMAADWIKSLAGGEEGVAFAVERTGAVIGCVGYRAMDDVHAEIGYWIGKSYWGLGYATEATQALIRHVFAEEGFDYLTVGHFRENPASARVIAKLGFEAAGETLRDCAARGGQAHCVVYRLTRQRALAISATSG